MHSSRMRTVRSSDCISGGVSAPGGSAPGEGGCLLPGGVCVSALGGVCLLWGGCLLRGVSAPGGVCVCSRGDVCSRGVSAPRGCLLPGVSALGGVVSQHALRQTPPPPLWTDRRL